MLNRYSLGGTLAAVCCSATMLVATAAAQDQPQQPQQPQAQQPQPQSQQPQQPQPAQTNATQTPGPSTVVGCIYRERDVPGRAPNVAERVGILEDYILMEIPGATPEAVASGAAASPGGAGATASAGATGRQTAEARGTTGATGTTGASGATTEMGRMYKLELIDDDTLQAHVGKRVEVTGRVDADPGDARNTAGTSSSTADEILGIDEVDLAEFEVSSIKAVDGTCPTLPDPQ